MNHSDFRAAVEVEVTRWRFLEIVRREFEQSDVPTGLVATERDPFALPGSGSRLLAPTDDGTPTRETPGSVNNRDS